MADHVPMYILYTLMATEKLIITHILSRILQHLYLNHHKYVLIVLFKEVMHVNIEQGLIITASNIYIYQYYRGIKIKYKYVMKIRAIKNKVSLIL